jgi:hypothetical protein
MARRVVGPLGAIQRNGGLQPPPPRQRSKMTIQPMDRKARLREIKQRQQRKDK